MPITYRTSGSWGAGTGVDLSASQIDNNFYYHDSLIAALEDHAGSGAGIDYFAVSGNNFFVHLTDHTILGPYALPVSQWHWRGPWTVSTSYAVNDVFEIDGSVYLDIYAPNPGQLTFDPNANDGLGHNFYALLITAPSDVLPVGGTSGQLLAKSVDSPDYAVEWVDAPHGLPAGGSSGEVLTKHSSSSYDAIWEAPAVSLPPGGSSGQVLTKHSSSDGDAIWEDTAAGVTTLAGDTDVALGTPFSLNTNDLFMYNGSKWFNIPATYYASVLSGVPTVLGTAGTVSLNPVSNDTFTITPTGDITLNAASAAFRRVVLIITTSGATSYNITFNTNFKSQGVLATGTSDAMVFTIEFVGDGTNLNETSRTTAM
jgi:hypothetical protein